MSWQSPQQPQHFQPPPPGYPQPMGPPPTKKAFRFQPWMLGMIIIPIGIAISIVNVLQKGTAEIGASCSMNDDCVKGLQCVRIDGKSQCTKQCSSQAHANDNLTCPASFTCTSVSMRAGTTDVPMEWCLAP